MVVVGLILASMNYFTLGLRKPRSKTSVLQNKKKEKKKNQVLI